MRLKYPPPRGDPEDPSTGSPDYNLSSPLTANVMCGGKPPGGVSATFTGMTIIID